MEETKVIDVEKQTAAPPSKKKDKKKPALTTELFKNKNIPIFIKEHTFFKTPTKLEKVFPTIGLPNFSDKVKIDKSFTDIKKEGSYVFNVLRTMTEIIEDAKTKCINLADSIQYLSSREEREANRVKITELYSINNILTELNSSIDPYIANAFNGSVRVVDNKIVLKLMKDIPDKNGKNVFRKDEPLFRIMNAIKEKCLSFGITITNLEQTTSFKVFSKENIPNKEYSVVFSSEGEEGAWDIATMSMRGIKSCQRWDGEYPRCLIGSILSKYVGIVYLTSGVKAEDHPSYSNLGTKMLRRCVVRFAIDMDENSPCILVDKMYPEYDKEVCNIFIKSIQARTKIPVHYAPELGDKMKHIYLPSEKVREKISNRDWSYQDTALKSKEDVSIFYLMSSSKEEIEKEANAFKYNFALHLAKDMEKIYNNLKIVDEDVRKTIKNIKMNTSFFVYCETLVEQMLTVFPITDSKQFKDSQSFYKKYLMDILMNRKKVFTSAVINVKTNTRGFVSRTPNYEALTTYIYSVMVNFIKIELPKTFS